MAHSEAVQLSSSRSSAQQSHVNAKTFCSAQGSGSFSAVEPARKSFRFGMHVNAKNCSARLHIHLSPPLRPEIARDFRCRSEPRSWQPATERRKFASTSRPGVQILSCRRTLDPFSSPQVSCSSSLHLAFRFEGGVPRHLSFFISCMPLLNAPCPCRADGQIAPIFLFTTGGEDSCTSNMKTSLRRREIR